MASNNDSSGIRLSALEVLSNRVGDWKKLAERLRLPDTVMVVDFPIFQEGQEIDFFFWDVFEDARALVEFCVRDAMDKKLMDNQIIIKIASHCERQIREYRLVNFYFHQILHFFQLDHASKSHNPSPHPQSLHVSRLLFVTIELRAFIKNFSLQDQFLIDLRMTHQEILDFVKTIVNDSNLDPQWEKNILRAVLSGVKNGRTSFCDELLSEIPELHQYLGEVMEKSIFDEENDFTSGKTNFLRKNDKTNSILSINPQQILRDEKNQQIYTPIIQQDFNEIPSLNRLQKSSLRSARRVQAVILLSADLKKKKKNSEILISLSKMGDGNVQDEQYSNLDAFAIFFMNHWPRCWRRTCHRIKDCIYPIKEGILSQHDSYDIQATPYRYYNTMDDIPTITY